MATHKARPFEWNRNYYFHFRPILKSLDFRNFRIPSKSNLTIRAHNTLNYSVSEVQSDPNENPIFDSRNL